MKKDTSYGVKSAVTKRGFCCLLQKVPILVLFAVAIWSLTLVPEAFGSDYTLTAAVLVNSGNSSGYNTNPQSPGEFQKYPERYLEHLQIPYNIFDVAKDAPPSDLYKRQLIIIGHSGVNLTSAWESAVLSAINGGTGLVNLDWSSNIGSKNYMKTIFRATGSSAGTPGTSITVPYAVTQQGINPHYIAALQKKFLGDLPGDFVYAFHADQNGVLNTAKCTVLQGANGTVIATIGSDPLILATTYGSARAVHFGTLDYLKADRFGFLMGIDDLFWRSLVWAARKPFAVRGYPHLWALGMDDTKPGWGFRIRDLYDEGLTGNISPDGIGGPWKVTGMVYTNNLTPGSPERASVISDINQGALKIMPHAFGDTNYGDIYWNGVNGQLSDSQWVTNLSMVLQWKLGQGGSDSIPNFSRSMVPHFWDLSNNTGWDLWQTLGFRYVTSILKPGYQNPWINWTYSFSTYQGAERNNARPFWLYEKPPKTTVDEDYSFFFADDYPVGSRAGLSGQTFFLFETQFREVGTYPRPDLIWPSSQYSFTVADSVDQFERYTWRLWSSLVPVRLYTHDSLNYEYSLPSDRQEVISQVSSWLAANGVQQLFQEELGDYVYARTKSVLTDVQLTGNNLTYTYQGKSATADNKPVATEVLLFYDNEAEGIPVSLSGFTGGATFSQVLPAPPPIITGVSPSSGPVAGGTGLTITGSNFVNVTAVFVNNNSVSNYTVNSPGSISTVTPAGEVGPANVTVDTASGRFSVANSFTYLGPPEVSSVSPDYGEQQGGTLVAISGKGFEPGSQVFFGPNKAAAVTYIDANNLTALTPSGTTGLVDVRVTNSQGPTTLRASFLYLSISNVNLMNFTYGSRQQLLATGWSFIAKTASGSTRNTEQTYGNYVVSYSQTAHPGSIEIPVGPGDIWQDNNDSQNTLFYTLPSNWRSIRLKVSGLNFDTDNQGVSLMAYQDDDNYVELSEYYSTLAGGVQQGFGAENSGVYSTTNQFTVSPSSTIFLRLDRDPTSEIITAFSSKDGSHWQQVQQSITKELSNPRLAVVVGSNTSDTSIPTVDINFAEVIAFDVPTIISIFPNSLTFSGSLSGFNPQSQALTISNAGTGNFNWTATADASWLAVSPVSGTTPGNLSVSADLTGLGVGTYSGTITVGSTGVANSPQIIPVTLIVNQPAPPTISGISPAHGDTTGGGIVQISGSGFVPGSMVTIGGVNATNITVNNATLITAMTPAGAVGLADVVVQTAYGTATLTGSFTFTEPGTVLYQDNFSSGTAVGWTMSPLGNASGWSAVSGAYAYNGSGSSQSYAGFTAWTDYTLSVDFKLLTWNNYPGGIRGRINPATGAGYAVWLYPANGQIILYRETGWNIDNPGLTQLGVAVGITFDVSNFHNLKLRFAGNSIEVYYDGLLVINVIDATYNSGLIALDGSNQPITFDNITVTGSSASISPSIYLTPSTLTFSADTGDPNPLAQTIAIANSGGGTLTWTAQQDASWLVLSATSGTAPSNLSVSANLTGLGVGTYSGTITVSATGVSNSPQSVPVTLTVNHAVPPAIENIPYPFGYTTGGGTIQINGSGFSAGSTLTIGGVSATNVTVNSATSITAVTPAGSVGPADVVVQNANGSATLTAGFTYIAPGTVLIQSDFASGTADGWTISPLGNATGWSVANGAYTYNGGGSTQSYAGDPTWTDYTLSLDFQLSSMNNYPGGIRGRVNPATGAGYAAWLYPANGQIILYRETGWNIDSPGLTQIGMASGIAFDAANFHNLKLSFTGKVVEVYFDGSLVISAIDGTYGSGLIALDVSNQPIAFENVNVVQNVLPPSRTVLFYDDFSDGTSNGWTVSPLGNAAGWSVVNGTYTYNGGGQSQAYIGSDTWGSDYTAEADIQLNSLNDYPGGIRGRLNLTSGAGYTAWLYPAERQIKLFRVAGWSIDSPGLVQLGAANGIAFDTNFHKLEMSFSGANIGVYYDGRLLFSVVDSTYPTGGIALDVSNQSVTFDNIKVIYEGWVPSAPNLAGISPNSTMVGGASFTLTVNGSNFVAGSVVQWNGANRTTTYVSPTQLNASISSADVANAGTAQVTVFTPAPGGGASTPQGFTINNPTPVLSGISPSSATAGGSSFTLTVNGSGFVSGSVVQWNGSSRATTYVSATKLTASITSADIATGGTAQVTVVTPAPGGGTSAAASFTANNPAPAITSLSPTSATAGGSTFTLTVNGTGFVTGSVVQWNGSGRTTTYVSSTRLTASISSADIATAGTAQVTVYNASPGGGTSSSRSFSFNNPVPSLTSLSPSSAAVGGSSFTLTVTGSGFVNGSEVRWNGSSRTTTYISSTQLQASITAADISSTGTAQVTVYNASPGGGTSSSRSFSINNPTPTLTSMSPTSANAGGSSFTLTVNGSGFMSSSVVRWGGVSRTTTYVSSTQLTASIPASDIATGGTDQVTVYNPTPGGGTSSALNFTTSNPVPAISSLSPSSARRYTSFTLTVNGSGFVNGSTIMWNGSSRTTTYVSSTQIKATISLLQNLTTGTFQITVVNSSPGGGTSNSVPITITN